ncbi:hypothetical protein ACYX7E_09980 [Luteimonas sp. RIT-PG2_3]
MDQIIKSVIGPGLSLLPAKMDSARARVMLIAIGLQESRMVHRRQIKGPARGLWQFERGGGVQGVLSHRASRPYALTTCAERGVDPTALAVYNKLERDDVLACAFARLLLWTDPPSLPEIGKADDAWALYIRTWRPGKPHRSSWDDLYRQAVSAVA